MSATWRRWTKYLQPHRASKPTATLADVVAHCQHVREVAGIDHIGLGGDYDGVDTLPEGLEDVAGYPTAARRARRRRGGPKTIWPSWAG